MKELSYSIKIHKNQFHIAEQWCQNHFGLRWEAIGNRQGNWACFWAGREDVEYYVFHFKYEKDCIMFMLKCS